jgi:hypothetical protein
LVPFNFINTYGEVSYPAHPDIYKFANFEEFFCCTGCMSGYRQKYAGRIEPIKRSLRKW